MTTTPLPPPTEALRQLRDVIPFRLRLAFNSCEIEEGNLRVVRDSAERAASEIEWHYKAHTQARADLEAENARLRSDAEAWRTHREKLDALIAFCPTCCAVVSASKDMTRDEVLFACGKAAGKAEVRSLREALEQIAAWDQHTSEFSADYGSNGVRDFYRGIARAALKEQP